MSEVAPSISWFVSLTAGPDEEEVWSQPISFCPVLGADSTTESGRGLQLQTTVKPTFGKSCYAATHALTIDKSFVTAAEV